MPIRSPRAMAAATAAALCLAGGIALAADGGAPECAALDNSLLAVPDWYAARCLDGSAVTEYRNNGDVGQPTPESAEMLMTEFGEFTGSGVAMTATEPTGIVAIDGGTQWGGVTNLALPFP